MIKASENTALEKLKSDISSGKIGNLYVFYGDEAYLREVYFSKIKALLVDRELEQLNYNQMTGKDFTPEALANAVEAYPVMAERRLIAVTDFDIMKPPAAVSDKILSIITDLPDYVTLIFIYDALEYKQDKKNPVCAKILETGSVINFKKAAGGELNRWIARRFSALNLKIDPKTCEYMTFYCGNSMTSLISEIEKAAAYCKTDTVKKSDIEAVCIKNLDAAIYELTDCLTLCKFGQALAIMRELILMNYEPVVLSGSICKQMLKLYSAALCGKKGLGKQYIMKIWEMKSAYPAEKLLSAASSASLKSIRAALNICGRADFEMKSVSGDRKLMLELMLLRISQCFAKN